MPSRVGARIAVLVQQAGFRDQHGALAIDMDGPAFEHCWGAEAFRPFDFQHFRGDLVVQIPGEIQPAAEPAPGVENPVHAGEFSLRIEQEGGAGIARPGIVAAGLHHAHGLGEHGAGIGELPGADQHGDRLEPRDGGGDRGEGGLRRLGAEPPIVRAFRPDHPAPVMRRPFRRHGVILRPRRQIIRHRLSSSGRAGHRA